MLMDILLDLIGTFSALLSVHDGLDDSQIPVNMKTYESLAVDGPDMVNLVRDAGLQALARSLVVDGHDG